MKIDLYRGQLILNLTPDARYPFSFGLEKAKLILANLAAIEAFVASNGKSYTPPSFPCPVYVKVPEEKPTTNGHAPDLDDLIERQAIQEFGGG